MNLLASIALALTVAFSFLHVGTAFLKLLVPRRFEKLELICYGVAAGVLLHGLIGICVALAPGHPRVFSLVLLLGANAAALAFWLRGGWRSGLKAMMAWESIVALAGWLLMILACVGISFLPVRLPEELPDGPYVIKNHHLHVRIQAAVGGFPADNYLPFLVGEFLLRHISFRDERPLLPGQEVSNRPILMALAALPFRAAVDPPPLQHGPLGKFDYLGQEWPDVAKLGDDRAFRQFLMAGIVLNATILLGAALLFASHGLRGFLVLGLLLMLSSPYFLAQTIFTWPKALAAFFILLAFHAMERRRESWLAALCLAAAYHAHPYALVFAGSLGLWTALRAWRGEWPWRQAALYGGVFLCVVAPWFILTRLVWQIPANLVAQNFNSDSDFADLAWTRARNLYVLLSPLVFAASPFSMERIVQLSNLCLPGAVGLFFAVQAYAGGIVLGKSQRFLLIFGAILPGLLLVAVFSVEVTVAIQGAQAIAPVAILFALLWQRQTPRRRSLALPLLAAQIALNMSMIAARARTLHAPPAEKSGQTSAASSAATGPIRLLETDARGKWRVTNAKIEPNFGVRITLGNVSLPTVWTNPPASVIYPGVRLGAHPRFACKVAIHPAVLKETQADGADFLVSVRTHGRVEEAGQINANPFQRPEDRGWVNMDIDLAKYAYQTVDLILTNAPGPAGNDYADWCLWGDPMIVEEAPLKQSTKTP